MNFTLLKKILNDHKNILITTHVNPDADAIGSEMATYYLLKQLNKHATIINHSPTPHFLNFLDPQGVVQKYDPKSHDKFFNEADLIIALDFNHSGRTVSMAKKMSESNAKKIVIDHHENPEDFADEYFLGSNYSATAEILYDFLKFDPELIIDKNIATNLYAAIMTDTGSFRYDRTTAKLHKAVADLIEKGADPTYIYDSIYDQNDIGKINLLGEALANIKLIEEGKIAYMLITQEALERTGAKEEDVDGFVNYCLSIKGVNVGLLFFELKDGFKVSFRSKGEIPINQLAKEYSGGGHKNAAGARFYDKSVYNLMDEILSSAKKFVQ